MNTSHHKYDSIERIIFEEGLRIQSVDMRPEDDTMFVYLNNNHTLRVRISLFNRLKLADSAALNRFEFIANGTGIHWPDLDEDLSLKGFLKEFLLQKVKSDRELIIA